MNPADLPLPIASVEREVGLSKDVLRVWERRYGFPTPLRDANDERVYPADQVQRLRLVKRLMDCGHRPGRLLRCEPAELEQLALAAAPEQLAASAPGNAGLHAELLAYLRSHDAPGLGERLQQLLAAEGLAHFVQDIAVPLAVMVGDEWARGRLHVFEEHLFTETCARVLRQATAALPPGRSPRVLLTTPPGEAHGLGLVMVESLLALHGARCVPLGIQTPLGDVVQAARAYGAHVVAMSFSSAFAPRRVRQVLEDLRQALPADVGLWAGGAGVQRLAAIEGVQLLPGLADAIDAAARWRMGR